MIPEDPARTIHSDDSMDDKQNVIASKNSLSPTALSERIQSLDVLRGFALLGILIMNIQSFSMPTAAYINPTAFGDLTGINKWVWILSHTLADDKFMTIFSTLFGAGLLIFISRAMEKGKNAMGLHYRRIFWLLIIGLIHAYFFWYGDILVGYAFCAAVVILFRKARPGWLVFFGILSMMIAFLISIMAGMTIEFWDEAGYQQSLQSWVPSVDKIQQEIAATTGTWMERMSLRREKTFFMETFLFLTQYSWHSGGVMLLGMALFKWDFLSAGKSIKTYRYTLIAGLIFGFTLVVFGLVQNFNHDWFHDYSMWIGSTFNYWGSLGLSLAYISLIMIICKKGLMSGLRRILSLIGRTALSNYLFQTLVCTFIFNGYGLGLFGKVQRWQQLLIVLLIWIIQITLTRLWLNRFRMGPAEWLWRSLTYWKIQAIR